MSLVDLFHLFRWVLWTVAQHISDPQTINGTRVTTIAGMAYLKPKLEAVSRSGDSVWAEMGTLNDGFVGPCVVLAQGGKDNLVAVVLAQVEGNSISRIDMCIVPTPQSAARSGVYSV